MYNKNIFTQKDPIADAISQIAEADYKAKMEELKGNQKVLDKNKNNKLDADDFKILRGEKKMKKEETEQQDESSNPFSKDYKSQIPTKPGEKAGFDSKKISTGTVYSKKHKPEPAEKETTKEEVEQIEETSYSAKAARAGKDIGKPGKMFKKIAKKAAARYGSMARGKKVAGAVLAKLRKEETDYEPLLIDQITEDTMSAIEKLDELKKATVKSYIGKKMDKIYSAKKAPGKEKARKDTESLQRAHERAVGNKPTSEEVEQIEEGKMDHMSLSSLWHQHAKHSYGADQGYGGGQGGHHSQHAATAIENHVRKHHGNKIADDMVHHSDMHVAHAEYVGSSKEAKEVERDAEKLRKKHKIEGGLYGMNEEVEQIEERTLTAGETAKKERIVKGMKKNLAGFKKRYGEKAKSVMYATATKAAKKD